MAATAPALYRARMFDALRADLRTNHLFEFWDESYAKDEHNAVAKIIIEQKAVAHVWRYDTIHPLLLRSAELIDIHESERRSILMVNPAFTGAIATLSTMMAAYRINLPDEIAPAHRHSPNAIRFGITGATNFTAVEGENIVFGPGDLVLTPHDTWHNHGNGGDVDAVNFSLLDLPLVNFLNATYFDFDYAEAVGNEKVRREVQSAFYPDDYSTRVYGRGGFTPRFLSHHRGSGDSSPMYVYRWEAARAVLDELRDHDGSPYDGIFIEYTDPVSGGPVYRTLTFGMQLIRPGERLLPQRQNANRISLVFEGAGYSIINGERYDWKQFDTIAVPGGSWCEHVNDSASDIIMFVSSDEPTLRNLAMLKKHGRSAQGDLVALQ